MDYDTDEKSMATLRRHLRGAREEYYRYKRFADFLSNICTFFRSCLPLLNSCAFSFPSTLILPLSWTSHYRLYYDSICQNP